MTPKLYTALRWGAILGGVLAIAEIAAYFIILRAAQDDLVAPLRPDAPICLPCPGLLSHWRNL